MSDISLQSYFMTLAIILAVACVAWLLSLWRNNVGVVDIFWPIFIWISCLFGYQQGSHTWLSTAVLILVSLWALRLAVFLFVRNWNEEEDRRYAEIRSAVSSGFALKSLPIIFLFQGVVAWLLGSIFFAIHAVERSPICIEILGLVMLPLGILYEAVADWQMWRFNQRETKTKSYMDEGLWRYSRHPNYFGECLIWWGLFVLAVPIYQLWIILPPLFVTWMLLKFSGVNRAEAGIESRRPGYELYKKTTSPLVPRLAYAGAKPKAGSKKDEAYD